MAHQRLILITTACFFTCFTTQSDASTLIASQNHFDKMDEHIPRTRLGGWDKAIEHDENDIDESSGNAPARRNDEKKSTDKKPNQKAKK